jgi:hypothetical protein
MELLERVNCRREGPPLAEGRMVQQLHLHLNFCTHVEGLI